MIKTMNRLVSFVVLLFAASCGDVELQEDASASTDANTLPDATAAVDASELELDATLDATLAPDADDCAINEIGFLNTPGSANDVEVVGTKAYVADGESGLRIIDVSNPASPNELGFYNTPGNALGVAVSGSFAYVADDASDLRVLDVSNAASPTEAAFLALGGTQYDAKMAGSLVYVLGTAGLQVVDVSSPIFPSLQDSAYSGNPSLIGDMHAVGNTIAYWTARNELTISSTATPTNIVELGNDYDNDLAELRGIFVDGITAYVGASQFGLYIYDVSNQAAPMRTGTIDTPGTAADIEVSNGLVYVVDGATVRIIDPIGLTQVFFNQSGSRDIEVVGDLAYVAAGGNGLRIFQLCAGL